MQVDGARMSVTQDSSHVTRHLLNCFLCACKTTHFVRFVAGVTILKEFLRSYENRLWFNLLKLATLWRHCTNTTTTTTGAGVGAVWCELDRKEGRKEQCTTYRSGRKGASWCGVCVCRGRRGGSGCCRAVWCKCKRVPQDVRVRCCVFGIDATINQALSLHERDRIARGHSHSRALRLFV